MDKAIYVLSRHGFVLTRRGALSASFRTTRAVYEKTFGTTLAKFNVDGEQDYSCSSFYFPPDQARWAPETSIAELIDDAYIQWPHIYMDARRQRPKARRRKKAKPLAAMALAGGGGGPSKKPPAVGYFHLNIPRDVVDQLNAKAVHAAGTTGKGVRVVMMDSGFAHGSHPYFAANGYQSTVDLAPGAINDKTDINGHGTGESANVFAVAPDATFIGVKLDNDNDPRAGASLLEGFQTAMSHRPQIISVSLGYDLRHLRKQMTVLPSSLAALEADIQSAVASGVIVVFSAGNGHFSFPGMMPDVISAGGVHVRKDGTMEASDYASAFQSKIYSGRNVPDFSGLVGMQPHAAYIMLPIPAGCELDHECAKPADGHGDGTKVDDAWGVFSGTSAAAPQLAAVCALLLEKNSRLTPGDVKAVLRRTARDVTSGNANPASSDDGVGMPAGAGDDGATGAGLVDAFAAWQQV